MFFFHYHIMCNNLDISSKLLYFIITKSSHEFIDNAKFSKIEIFITLNFTTVLLLVFFVHFFF
jgi:hypothetical protein